MSEETYRRLNPMGEGTKVKSYFHEGIYTFVHKTTSAKIRIYFQYVDDREDNFLQWYTGKNKLKEFFTYREKMQWCYPFGKVRYNYQEAYLLNLSGGTGYGAAYEDTIKILPDGSLQVKLLNTQTKEEVLTITEDDSQEYELEQDFGSYSNEDWNGKAISYEFYATAESNKYNYLKIIDFSAHNVPILEDFLNKWSTVYDPEENYSRAVEPFSTFIMASDDGHTYWPVSYWTVSESSTTKHFVFFSGKQEHVMQFTLPKDKDFDDQVLSIHLKSV